MYDERMHRLGLQRFLHKLKNIREQQLASSSDPLQMSFKLQQSDTDSEQPSCSSLPTPTRGNKLGLIKYF